MADRDQAISAIDFARRFHFGRYLKWKHTDDVSVRIVAEKIIEHLERSCFVIEHRPPPNIVTVRFPPIGNPSTVGGR